MRFFTSSYVGTDLTSRRMNVLFFQAQQALDKPYMLFCKLGGEIKIVAKNPIKSGMPAMEKSKSVNDIINRTACTDTSVIYDIFDITKMISEAYWLSFTSKKS